jgi:hypothetical protein
MLVNKSKARSQHYISFKLIIEDLNNLDVKKGLYHNLNMLLKKNNELSLLIQCHSVALQRHGYLFLFRGGQFLKCHGKSNMLGPVFL